MSAPGQEKSAEEKVVGQQNFAARAVVAALNIKDISDWMKIVALVVTIAITYQHLADRVEQQGRDIAAAQARIEEIYRDSTTQNYIMGKDIGSIKMYLSSRDKHYYDLQEQNRPIITK